MMEIISDNERRENLISQFNEFLEYVSWEFGSEIDCHQLVSSIEYVELFEHMYSQVCDYCSAETNDKIADLVSTIEDSDSITFDEVESAIIEICNMIENISYRHSMNIDNDIYVKKQFALPGGSIKYGRRNSTDAVTPNVDEDDEEEKDSRDADALIEYVKSVTENNEISWFETDMIDKISTNFALNSLNMNPQIKNKVDDDDVIRTRTIFASFDYDNCVSKLENMFGSFSFDNGEEIKEYRIIIFVTIRAYGGRTYNSLSLLSVLEDEYTSQQTVSGYFLHASEDEKDEILEMINENIDAFGDLSDVDEDNIESLDMDIAACETKKSFMTFYRVLLTKCPEEFASELISDLDSLIEGFANRIAYRQLKKVTIQARNLLISLGIDPDEASKDTPVADLELTEHTRKCLEIAGIENVSDLTAMDIDELASIKTFGRRECIEVLRVLDGLGYRIEGCDEDDYEDIEDFISEKYPDFAVNEYTYMSEIQFSQKTMEELRKLEILSIRDLLKYYAEDLEKECDFEVWCLEEIETCLEENNYALKHKHSIYLIDWLGSTKALLESHGIEYIEDLITLRMSDVMADYGPHAFVDIVHKLDRMNYRLVDCPKELYPEVRDLDDLFRCKKCGTRLLDRAGISIGYCDECKSAVMNTKAGRCAGSKTISLDIGEPEYMSFSNGQDGFVIYLNLNVICNKPMTLELHESLLYTNGRQWARDFNYTGYGFEKETVEPGKPRKIGWIWINEKWPNKKLIEEENYMTVTFNDSDKKLYCLKYVYCLGSWRFDDYYEIVDED